MLVRAVLAWVLILHTVLPPSLRADDELPRLPAPTPQESLAPAVPQIPSSLEMELAEQAIAAQDCPAAVARVPTATQLRVARATAAAEAAIAQSVEAIRAITLEIENAKACGQNVKCTILRLQSAANEVRALALPILIGYSSETFGLARDQLNRWIFRIGTGTTTEETRQTFTQGLMAFLRGIGSEFSKNFSAVKSEELRKDPVVLFDLVKRLFVVLSFQGIAMGIAAWNHAGDPNYRTPWEMFLNTVVMMWLQSEVSARNTPRDVQVLAETNPSQEAAELPPARDRFELYGRIPAMIAGKSGLLKEFALRLWGFANLYPFEIVMLFGIKTAMSAVATWGASLFDPSVWMANGLATAAFISVFGLYLSLKDSIAAKQAELRLFPEVQRMNSAPFQAKWDALAEQHGIPHKGPDAWRGWMVRQFFQSFWPDAPPATEPSAAENEKKASGWKTLFQHLVSGSVWEKLQRHFADRRRFKAFWNLPAVAEVRKSPEARRAWYSQFLEFVFYRVPMTLFDSYVAVSLMGKGDAKAAAESAPASP